MLKQLRHSLAARLILLFIVAGVVLLVAVSVIMGQGFKRHFRQNIQPYLAHYSELLQRELGSPPNRLQAERLARRLHTDIDVFGPHEQWSTAEHPLQREALQPLSPRRHRSGRRPIRFMRLDDNLIIQTRNGPHEVYFRLNDHRGLHRNGPFGLIILGIIATVLLLVYLATRSLIRPLREIRAGVQRIGNGELNHRIAKFRNDELGHLTDSVNAMAADIHAMLEAKRELLLAISHELRSPLTRSRVNLALLEQSTAKAEIEKDVAIMEQLITELLESERLNSRYAKLQTEAVELRSLITALLSHEFNEKTITQRLPQHKVVAELDPIRIKLLLRNLLNNAIQHSEAAQQPPEIALTQTEHSVKLAVIDHGGGIDPVHIPFLTEPFYRADPSRQRKTGGYGLGLYLCRMIVEAHGGELAIKSEPGVGTQIECILPLGCS